MFGKGCSQVCVCVCNWGVCLLDLALDTIWFRLSLAMTRVRKFKIGLNLFLFFIILKSWCVLYFLDPRHKKKKFIWNK